jgi:opacity protein-like surface antigen
MLSKRTSIKRLMPTAAIGLALLTEPVGFKTEIEELHTDATPSRNLLSTAGLSTNRLMLNGTYEFSDGSWRLTPYVGAAVEMVDGSEWLLNSSPYRVTAYELRGGVTLGLTQKLLGGLEYRWTNGSKPYLSLAGIPAKLQVDNHKVRLGVNYHF